MNSRKPNQYGIPTTAASQNVSLDSEVPGINEPVDEKTADVVFELTSENEIGRCHVNQGPLSAADSTVIPPLDVNLRKHPATSARELLHPHFSDPLK